MTARLIAKLPCKDSGRFRVPGNESLDVCLVCFLSGGIGVECCGIAAERNGVGVDATIVTPIVHEIEDELDAVLLGR